MAFPETQADRLARQRAATALLRAQPGYVNPASPGRVAPARVYQDEDGIARQNKYGRDQALRGGSEDQYGNVPHATPVYQHPSAPADAQRPANVPQQATGQFSVPPEPVVPINHGPASALTPGNAKPLTVQPNWLFPPGRVPQQPDSEVSLPNAIPAQALTVPSRTPVASTRAPVNGSVGQPDGFGSASALSPANPSRYPGMPAMPTTSQSQMSPAELNTNARYQGVTVPRRDTLSTPQNGYRGGVLIPSPSSAPPSLLQKPQPTSTPAWQGPVDRTGELAASNLSDKIAGIMAAPATQGPVMDSPRIQAIRAQKDANVSTYDSMGQSPELQARMESGYNRAMRIGQPTQAGEQPQSIFQRQAPPNNRMQGSVPVGPIRDMSGANGVQMGELRPNTGNVAYVPGNGTDGSVGSARYVEGRRLEPLTPGGRGTVVQRGPNGGMELIGDELTDEQRQYYANQSARIAQAQKDHALDYKDTRALRALGRNPSLKNKPAVADALVRRAESVQGKATSMANARAAEARDRAFKDEMYKKGQDALDAELDRKMKAAGPGVFTSGGGQDAVMRKHIEQSQGLRDSIYGNGGTAAGSEINPADPSRVYGNTLPPIGVGGASPLPQATSGYGQEPTVGDVNKRRAEINAEQERQRVENQQQWNERQRGRVTPISMPLQSSMYDQMEPAFGFGNDPSRVMPQVPVSPFPGVRRDMLGSTQFPKLTAQQQQELLRRALRQQSQQPSY